MLIPCIRGLAAAILWTDTPSLMEIPSSTLDAATFASIPAALRAASSSLLLSP